MKKKLRLFWVLMLCACSLVLVACGGGAAGGGEPSIDEPAVTVDPSEKFIRTWKVAGLESQGMTIVGDFSMMLGSEDGFVFDVKADGKGTAAFGDETADFTWELKDDNTLHVNPSKTDEAEDESDVEESIVSEGLDFTYQDDTLRATNESTDDEGNTTSFTMILNESGVLPDAPVIDLEQATAITSEDQLLGDWTLSGLKMFGATMYGSSGDLAAIYGEDTDTSLSFKDGAVNFMGSEYSYTIGDEGAVIDMAGYYQLPVKQLGDMLIVDIGSLLGEGSVMAYSK